MGTATVTCLLYCTCNTTTFNGHHSVNNSQVFMHQVGEMVGGWVSG
jgi:hypothetical protein